MRRIAFTVGYDGTDYAGWQRQENGPSVQQTLEEVFEKLFQEKVHVMGSGRTDAGVHARGQTACVDLEHPIDTEHLKMALNANLPDDIRIYRAWEVPSDFHPRFCAKKKTYLYTFAEGRVLPPELSRYAVLVPYSLEDSIMQQALRQIEGTHDFAAFRSAGGENLSTVRTVYQASLLKRPGWQECGIRLYSIQVCGNGFLYNMVRIIAGTVLEIGEGRRSLSCIQEAFKTGSRDVLGATAPAKGLMLLKVEYDA